MFATPQMDGHQSISLMLPATIQVTTIQRSRVSHVMATARLLTINSRNTLAFAPLVMPMILNQKALTMGAELVPWNKIKIAVVAVQAVTVSAIVIFNELVTRCGKPYIDLMIFPVSRDLT